MSTRGLVGGLSIAAAAAGAVLLLDELARGEPGPAYETEPGSVDFYPYETTPGEEAFPLGPWEVPPDLRQWLLPDFTPASGGGGNPYAPGSNCGMVYDAARAAGFTDGNAKVLAAIAEAESGCGAGATCNSCAGVKEFSVGPLQLNLLAHPWVTEACARDFYCAAAAAYRISGGSNFRPWSTYTSGRYLPFLRA